MKAITSFLSVLAIGGLIAVQAADFEALGPPGVSVHVGSGRDCTGDLIVNHDGSFENAYAARGEAVMAPSYGAFGEGFSISGPKTLTCIGIYITTLANLYQGQSMDIFVWEGGVSGPPGAVLAINPDQVPGNVPVWPEIHWHLDEINLPSVDGEITVGYWGDYSESYGFFILADESGWGGQPWVKIAPGLGYPPDWQHPSVVPSWALCKSLGFGIYVDEEIEQGSQPVESPIWNSIKSQY